MGFLLEIVVWMTIFHEQNPPVAQMALCSMAVLLTGVLTQGLLFPVGGPFPADTGTVAEAPAKALHVRRQAVIGRMNLHNTWVIRGAHAALPPLNDSLFSHVFLRSSTGHNPAVKADACRLRRQSPFTSALGTTLAREKSRNENRFLAASSALFAALSVLYFFALSRTKVLPGSPPHGANQHPSSSSTIHIFFPSRA
jgi:hypothetical protein